MQIVYTGRYESVEVPDVGGVVLERDVPKEVADTETVTRLLEQPDFSEAKGSSKQKRSSATTQDTTTTSEGEQ